MIIAVLLTALATLFWTGSRYPALDEKAMMSGAIQLEDSLSFEAAFPVSPDMSVPERIFWTTLNWINTNKKGMIFGVLFAAAFLTAAGYLKQRSFAGQFSNSALGLALGAPLGVCVNCAAPIAKGMFAGGMRAETTLSAMIASPTLNVVVLTMLFSLLPVYMAVTKVALSLLLILLIVPLICRFLPQDSLVVAPDAMAPTPWSSDELGRTAQRESLASALIGTAVSFAQNLWYIIKMTVPLMLLAGFLGAMVATLLPADLVLGLKFGLFTLLAVAAVGVFLPVPIAFDVVVTGALLASGLEPGFVMALLFTLGSFSVYSFFIVGQTISWRAAWMLSAAVVAFGVVAGAGAQRYHHWQSDRALEMLLGFERLLFRPAAASELMWAVTSDDAPRISVTAMPYAPPSPPADTPFTRVEARTIGIDKPLEFTMRDMWPPFWEGRSVSTGDIDRDGDLDLVIASTEAGLYVYDNDGTGQFTRVVLPAASLLETPIFNAALSDLDNDGWPDLFVTTYKAGNYILWNREGRFDPAAAQPVANQDDALLTLALAFDDLNSDGFLDVALGNWAAGWYRRVPGEESRNRMLLSDSAPIDGRSHADLPGIPGETLSILMTDMDLDGRADLIVGNDFEIPDYFYFGDGTGALAPVSHHDGLVPHTTTTTMSVNNADLNNDGRPEIYLSQIAGRSSGVSETLKMQPLERYCDTVEHPEDRAACDQNMAIKTWYKSGNNFDPTYASRCERFEGRYKAECKAMLIKDLAIQRRDPGLCKLIPQTQNIPRAYCDIHFVPPRPITAAEAEASMQQILRSNVLLERPASGAPYADTASARGLEIGGWSWDTKIADFDNDGFPDVYVVNGTWVPNEVSPSNLFFHNDGQGHFAEMSGPFGLEDYLMTAAATVFDMDNDGDLDLVTHTVNGPLAAFRNNSQDAHAISFDFDDGIGNTQGIGARVVITHGDQTQMREVQMGGGFMSFDAPRVHFGLGATEAIDRVEIHWRTGGITRIDGPLPAGALYRVRRDAD